MCSMCNDNPWSAWVSLVSQNLNPRDLFHHWGKLSYITALHRYLYTNMQFENIVSVCLNSWSKNYGRWETVSKWIKNKKVLRVVPKMFPNHNPLNWVTFWTGRCVSHRTPKTTLATQTLVSALLRNLRWPTNGEVWFCMSRVDRWL